MFADATAVVRFHPDRPCSQLMFDSQDCRVEVIGLGPGQTIRPHSTSSTVLIYVMEGCGRTRIGGCEQDVSAGSITICLPGEEHAVAVAPGSTLTLLVVTAPKP